MMDRASPVKQEATLLSLSEPAVSPSFDDWYYRVRGEEMAPPMHSLWAHSLL